MLGDGGLLSIVHLPACESKFSQLLYPFEFRDGLIPRRLQGADFGLHTLALIAADRSVSLKLALLLLGRTLRFTKIDLRGFELLARNLDVSFRHFAVHAKQ